jgi:hypothetical protein
MRPPNPNNPIGLKKIKIFSPKYNSILLNIGNYGPLLPFPLAL